MALAENAPIAAAIGLSFAAIALLTWYFSKRPRAMIRFYPMPYAEMRQAARNLLRNPHHEQSMKSIATLQLIAAILISLAVLLLA